MPELEFKGVKSFDVQFFFPQIRAPNILRIYLHGKITKYFSIDSIAYGAVWLSVEKHFIS